MRVLTVCVVLAVLCVSAHVCAQGDEGEATYSADSPVTILTSANFEEVINSKGSVLVEFFAPWCGHCKSLKPIYEEAAKSVNDAGIDAVVAALDATAEEDVASQFGIQGFPTLKLFRNGKPAGEYDGSRTAEGIFEFLELQSLPAVTEIQTQDEIDALLAKVGEANKVIVLGAFDDQNEAARNAFIESATKMREDAGYSHVRCVEVVNKKVAAANDLHATPVVRMMRGFDGEAKQLEFDFFSESGFNAEKVQTFLQDNAFPLLAEISPENYASYEKRGLDFFWIFFPGHGSPPPFTEDESEHPTNSDEVNAQIEQYKKIVREASADFAGKFSIVHLSGEDYADHAESLGVDVKNLPAGVVTQAEGSKRWVMDSDKYSFDVSGLSSFMADYSDGKVEPHVRSEPVPDAEAEANANVKTVVAKTFDDFMFGNDDEAVFIEFYAPWCGHCKQVAPKWEKLAKQLSSVQNVKIAKIDATANDVPDNVQGFPMFYFKKPGDKQIVAGQFYEGDRSIKGFLQHIRENAPQVADDLPEPAIDVAKVRAFVEQFEGMAKELKRILEKYEETEGSGGDDEGEEDGEAFDADFDEMGGEEFEGGEYEDEQFDGSDAHDEHDGHDGHDEL
jgi:protein disulfide-isomerase A1